jgi:hypothetical protein
MISIVGILVVFGAVIGGFLMEKGKLAVLIQPAELVTIGGAALGTVLVANPIYILKGMFAGLLGALGGAKFPKQRYIDTLKMMFDLFSKARKEGLVAIEADIEEADKSPIFSKYPVFLKDHHARDFVCDTMRMAITGRRRRPTRSPRLPTHCRDWALWPRCWALWSPWARSAARRRRLATRSPRPWWAPSSASSCATACLARWPRA